MVAAWEGIRDAAIRSAFVASLLRRIRSHEPGFPQGIGLRSRALWPERLAQDGERRSLLLRSTILAVEYSPYILRGVRSALLLGPADSAFLLEMAREGDEALRQKISMIFFMLDWEHPDVLTAISRGTEEGVIDRSLATRLYVELGSEMAQQLRDGYRREEREAIALQDAIDEKIQILNQLLDRSEGGEPDVWFRIWDSILVADWPGAHGWGGSSRLDQLSPWVYFDDPTRERIYLAARRCVLNGTRPPLDFLDQTGWPSWVTAEFAALLNTAERTPDDLLAVDDNVWGRWSTLVLWYPFTGTAERDRVFHGFLAQRLQPFLAAAEQVFDLYVSGNRNCSIVEGLCFHWSPEIANFVLDQTSRIDLANSSWDSLVALGLTEARQLFEEYLWEEFDRLSACEGEGRDARLITIVALLLRYAKSGTWDALRNFMYAEPSIGQEAIGRAGSLSEENKWLEHLEDSEIAGLYIWMNRLFPADIGHIQGATFFGGPVTIRLLRDSALVSMRSRGNLTVFGWVLQALPDLKWLPAQRAYVEEAHFRHRWRVETPEGLLRMAAENSVPWYLKERYQVVLLVGAFLGLAVGIVSLITAEGTWRIVTMIICSVIFFIIVGLVIRLRMSERRPKA
jgi:hypothetical protein